MRYLKWLLIVAFVGMAMALVIMNIEVLGQELIFRLALPWHPLGYLLMPIWTALLTAFVAGFALAVLLEMGAWYQYTRTIRLQRRQIQALQDEMEKSKSTTPQN